MKLLLVVAVCCLALHTVKGAPRKAVYKFLRCNPEGNKANCVTQQSPEMTWSPDLPSKLPPSTAQYLEAEPVEDEKPDGVVVEDKEEEYEDTPMLGEEGESPMTYFYEDGSGGREGSGAWDWDLFMADKATETGSGESPKEDSKPETGGRSRSMWRLFRSKPLVGGAKPAEKELREDHLLQL